MATGMAAMHRGVSYPALSQKALPLSVNSTLKGKVRNGDSMGRGGNVVEAVLIGLKVTKERGMLRD